MSVSVLALPIQDAINLQIQINDGSDNLFPVKYDFLFNISDQVDCTNSLFSNRTNLTTSPSFARINYTLYTNLNYSEQYYIRVQHNRTGTDSDINCIPMRRTPYTFRAKLPETLLINNTGESFIDTNFPQNLNFTGNLTLGDRIIFRLGEIIDNLLNGWITITGNLRITGNVNVTEDVIIGGNLNVTQNINSSQNITATYFFGNGSRLNISLNDLNDVTIDSITSGSEPFLTYIGTNWVRTSEPLVGDSVSVNTVLRFKSLLGEASWTWDGVDFQISAGADIKMADNDGFVFGTDGDSRIFYDGVNLIINPQSFGSGHVVIGVSRPGTDYRLTFDGETNNGVITFMEDEAEFRFDRNVNGTNGANATFNYFFGNGSFLASPNVSNANTYTDTQISNVNTTLNIRHLINATKDWILNFTQIFSSDWSNVTITESQITDLNHKNYNQDLNTTSNVTFNNITVTDNSNIAGNLTIGDRLIFRLGEIIDNLIDGLITITGNLNVIGNTTTQGINFGGRQIFSAYDSVGGLGLTSSYKVIPFDTENRKDIFYIHSTSGDNVNITINYAGDYRITYDLCTTGSGIASSSDSIVQGRSLINNVLINGSYTFHSHEFVVSLSDHDVPEKFCSSATFVNNFNLGDNFTIQAKASNGQVATLGNGTRLYMEFVG